MENLEYGFLERRWVSDYPRKVIEMKIVRQPLDHLKPGSTIAFDLKVTTNRPIKIISAMVTFRCYGELLRPPTRRATIFGVPVDPVVVKEELYSERTLSYHHTRTVQDQNQGYGFILPRREAGTATIPTTAHENKPFNTTSTYILNVKMELPERLPDSSSFTGDNCAGAVKSVLKASLTYRRPDTVVDTLVLPTRVVDSEGVLIVDHRLWDEARVEVRNDHVPVERLGIHQASENGADQTVGIPFFRGQIHCQLKSSDILVRLGHDAPLVVDITNDSSKDLRKVSLALYKEYSFAAFRDDQYYLPAHRKGEKVFKVPLPPVPPHTQWHRDIVGFTIPTSCQTSLGLEPCFFVQLRFFVRLKVKWRFGSMRCDVPIHLGTHSTFRQRPVSSAPDQNRIEQYNIIFL